MSRRIALIAVVLLSLTLIGAGGPEKPVPLPEGLVAPNVVADVAGTVCFLEGPAVDADGNVFFSDIAGNNLITNLAFGGPERKTLYVTAGKTVYRIPVSVPGYALYPK
jgi:gluconolactonase